MAERLKRASFARLAVAMAALALPLFAVGTAQAAIGGAPAESTTSAPDLVSATAIDSSDVDFCFDKQIANSGLNAAGFSISTYNETPIAGTAAGVEQDLNTTGKCVRVSFTVPGDINQYTIASVGGTAGAGAASGVKTTPQGVTFRYDDSTTLATPKSTKNGTTGYTVGPDLVSVMVDITSNSVTYNEDQPIVTTGGHAPAGADFTVTRSGGTQCTTGTVIAASGTSVTVAYPGGCPVTDAVRAGQIPGAVYASDDPSVANAPEQVIVPGTTGITSRPDLTSATLSADGSAISYTFDKAGLSVGPVTDFGAVLSTGAIVGASGATATTNGTTTTVRVTFTGLSIANEYVVGAAVAPGAVADPSAGGNTNVFDEVPAGDNAGALARGFTVGPDVTGAVINRSTGVVSVGLDQRAFSFAPLTSPIYLLDSSGTRVATAAATGDVTFPLQGAGPETIQVAFSQAQATTGTNLDIPADALLTGILEPNVSQITAMTSSSTLLHEAKIAKKQTKRFDQKRAALVRKQQKRLLSKLSRKIHHKL